MDRTPSISGVGDIIWRHLAMQGDRLVAIPMQSLMLPLTYDYFPAGNKPWRGYVGGMFEVLTDSVPGLSEMHWRIRSHHEHVPDHRWFYVWVPVEGDSGWMSPQELEEHQATLLGLRVTKLHGRTVSATPIYVNVNAMSGILTSIKREGCCTVGGKTYLLDRRPNDTAVPTGSHDHPLARC